MVILDVAPEISTIVPNGGITVSTGVTLPSFDVQSAQSRVAVPSGQTVVIGGLMKDSKSQTIDKVPLLGDIPWVGELFKHRQEDKVKQELLIFMTPQVVARPDMLEGVGQDQVKTTKILPNAVAPGVFEEHMEGMKAGNRPIPGMTTQPAYPQDMPPQAVPPEGRGGGGPGGYNGGGRGGPGPTNSDAAPGGG
jgi:general secretion pathway protein D